MISRLKTFASILILSGVALCFGCSEDPVDTPNPDSGPMTDGQVTVTDGPPPNAELTWSREIMDYENAGKFTSVASSGDKIGVVYFSRLDDKVIKNCSLSGTEQLRLVQDLKYLEYSGGGWKPASTIVQTVEGTFGSSIVFDQSGTPHVGYLGGELSLRECASSDAVIASSADGLTWTENIILAAGNTGDTVGHWMSVALNPADGSVDAAYRDVHFGYYEQDGNARADLLMGGGEEVSPDIGDGVNTNLLFKADGTPVVVAYNPTKTGVAGGIKVYVKTADEWVTRQIAPVGKNPSFATDGKGNFMVAYYHPTKKSLLVLESADLELWTPAVTVDSALTYNGTFASVAYDSAGNPGVSYYRCSDAGAQDCEPNQDGLMFAWRHAGKWTSWEVDSGGTNTCGQYTGLAFNSNDEPFIGYQCVTFDNLTNEFVEVMKVAQGAWKTK
ncbi:MAG: hypothetical protein JRH20_07530 [Deltaproteobacteria bacterium]|nr:hypothetical protein [Deltaproteobacteria bacterium]